MVPKGKCVQGMLHFRTPEEAQAAEARIRKHGREVGFQYVAAVTVNPGAYSFVSYLRLLSPTELPRMVLGLVEERESQFVSARPDLVHAHGSDALDALRLVLYKRDLLDEVLWGGTCPKPITPDEFNAWSVTLPDESKAE